MCPDSKGAGGTMGEHQDHLVFVLPIFQVNQSKVCVLLGGLDDPPLPPPTLNIRVHSLQSLGFELPVLSNRILHI